jgi:hypothetical protein
MSSKYVPPALRNKPSQKRNFDNKPEPPVEQPEVCEFNESNFPSLGNPKNKMTVWGGSKSFADLANEWKSKDETDEIMKQSEERKKTQESTYLYRQNIPLPKFHNVRRFIEPEDEKEQTVQQEESEWVLVDRKKVRREKTVEELIAKRELESAKESSETNEEQAQEYESYWDN